MSKFKSKGKAKAAPAADSVSDKAQNLVDSAQQIWMAGMGAFSRAQEQGTKLFEALVKEGVSLEQKTRKFATGKVDNVRDVVENKVEQVKERATDSWEKLEGIFESRVSRVLGKLGVPGRAEMEALIARVEELNKAVHKMNKPQAAASKRSTKAAAEAAVEAVAEAAAEAPKAVKRTAKRAVSKAKKALA